MRRRPLEGELRLRGDRVGPVGDRGGVPLHREAHEVGEARVARLGQRDRVGVIPGHVAAAQRRVLFLAVGRLLLVAGAGAARRGVGAADGEDVRTAVRLADRVARNGAPARALVGRVLELDQPVRGLRVGAQRRRDGVLGRGHGRVGRGLLAAGERRAARQPAGDRVCPARRQVALYASAEMSQVAADDHERGAGEELRPGPHRGLDRPLLGARHVGAERHRVAEPVLETGSRGAEPPPR